MSQPNAARQPVNPVHRQRKKTEDITKNSNCVREMSEQRTSEHRYM